jgi:hypothetical protein
MALYQQEADQLGGEDLGEADEVLGWRGGYGSGLVRLC